MSSPRSVEPRFPFADGALTASQRPAVEALVETLVEDLTPIAVTARLPELRERLESVIATPADFESARRFIGRVVWWAPAIGYWLSWILHLITKDRRDLSHPWACVLYADAQAALADDRSLSSLEVGYVSYRRVAEALGRSPAPPLERLLVDRMRTHHRFYAQFLRQLAYPDINPLVANLHTELTWNQLLAAYPEVRDVPPTEQRDVLEAIAASEDPDAIFHRVLARKWLGIASCHDHDWATGERELRGALADARAVSLFGEIGHLRRLLGHALRRGGDAEAAAEQFETALREEHPVDLFRYWRSLSAHELGDARKTLPAMLRAPADASALAPALEAYAVARNLLDAALVDDPLPAGRVAKQQCARSYANNAVDAARMVGRFPDLVAEIEAGGPRGTAEALAELCATGEEGNGYIRDREVATRHFATVPGEFDEYLNALPSDYTARLRYQRRRGELSARLVAGGMSSLVAERVLELRVPDAALLLFFVGWIQTVLVLLPLDGSEPEIVDVVAGERDLLAIDESFRANVSTDGPPNQGLRVRAALHDLIAAYEERFGPAFERLLPHIRGKQLKILPREQMVRAPLHALKVSGTPLIDHCDVSYGVSLELLLGERAAAGEPRPALVHDPRSGPLLGALRGALARSCDGAFTDLGNPTWPELDAAVPDLAGADLVFACHGVYDPLRPAASRLYFGAPDGVRMASILASLEPSRLASVTMAACESGMVRAEISAEYLGLASVFLSAGVPHVVGTLWQVNKLAAAMFVTLFFEYRREQAPVRALNDAVRALRSKTRAEVAAWIEDYLPERAPLYVPALRRFGEQPFEHPDAWAPFLIVGGF